MHPCRLDPALISPPFLAVLPTWEAGIRRWPSHNNRCEPHCRSHLVRTRGRVIQTVVRNFWINGYFLHWCSLKAILVSMSGWSLPPNVGTGRVHPHAPHFQYVTLSVAAQINLRVFFAMSSDMCRPWCSILRELQFRLTLPSTACRQAVLLTGAI